MDDLIFINAIYVPRDSIKMHDLATIGGPQTIFCKKMVTGRSVTRIVGGQIAMKKGKVRDTRRGPIYGQGERS